MTMKIATSMIHRAARAARPAVLALPCALVLSMLAACSNKPPGCADPDVTGLVKQIVEDNLVKKADPDGLSRMQVGLSLITESGYDKDVGKWACSGQLTLQTRPEVLKAVNDEIGLIQTVTHPNATQAITLGLYRMAGKKVLSDEEEGLAFALEARGWKPYSQDELKTPVTFSSQFEAGSKNLVVGVNGAAALGQFPQLSRLAFERQQREAKAQANSAQSSPQPTPAATNKALKIQVAKAEMCGPEALCITDSTGATYTGNAFAIADADRAHISEAAKSQGAVCLDGVTADKTFESVAKCSDK